MRIERLDLARYGRFTDVALDFGEKPERPDFHIVYGLNEAGKSTAAAAILDLLFGMETRTRYGSAEARGSWHAYSAMKVGARLGLSGGPREVVRLKRERNSLVDRDNVPLDEALIRAELSGLDRASFRTMFSLDDEGLEEGGEAILASKGDLGQLLFSASAGLASLSGRLGALRDEADGFHRPRGHKTELAEKKRALDALREERDRIDTLASAHAQLLRDRAAAQVEYDASTKTIGERRARTDAIQKLLAGRSHLIALREAERALAALGDLPAAPESWRDEAAKLDGEAIRLAACRDAAASTSQALEAELRELGGDVAALAAAARVDGWRESRSRYVSAKDIPVREGERAAKRDAVAENLRRLGREVEKDPKRLLLPVAAIGALEDLIAERSGVLTKLEAARAARDDAEAALADAIAEAPGGEGREEAVGALQLALQRARRDDSAAQIEAARGEQKRMARQLQDVLAALQPWRDWPEALAAVQVPSEAETGALRRRAAEAHAERANALKRAAEKSAEAERVKAEVSLAALAEGVSDEAAATLRSAREQAWSVHRAKLDGSSADAFEAALRRDDSAGAARLASVREVAAERERAKRLAVAETERAQARGDVEAAEATISALGREICALMPFALPNGREPLAFIDAWRRRRDEALVLIDRLRAIKDEAGRLHVAAERGRTALGAALRRAGVALNPEIASEAMMEAAEAAIAAETRLAALRHKVKERRAEAARAEARLKEAADDDARWRKAWRDACGGSWLCDAGAEPPLGAVRQALKALDALRESLRDCAELDHRIEGMERDRRLFRVEVAEVLRALGEEAGDDPIDDANGAEARVARARENEKSRREKLAGLAKVREALTEFEEDLAVNGRLTAAMTSLFGVETLREVAEKLEACRRRDLLRDQIARERHAILAIGVADGFEASRAALEGADTAPLTEELATLKAREPDDVAANAAWFAVLSEATRRLEAVGGDDAVARIEEKRRTILEEIKEGARRYLSLRAGIATAEAALTLYRDRHRGAMMERASRAFSEISRGAYRGLAAEPVGDREALIALGRDGGSKMVDQLSKGARFQLYLALRVAGYHELARTRVPAPFVADDIMETFDHVRAEEALRLFAEMGRIGQVMYFTHHLHLAEIAGRVCPGVRIHELAA